MLASESDILIIGINYKPEHTGIAPYTSGMAASLATLGFSVSVLTSHPHYPHWKVSEGYGGWVRSETVDGVEVTRLQHFVPFPPKGIRRLISELSFGFRLLFQSWKKPDVIVLVSPAMISSAIAKLKAKFFHRGIPVVVWVQDLYSRGMKETSQGNSFEGKLIGKIESWLLTSADGVLVIHDKFADVIKSDFAIDKSRIRTVRNWSHIKSEPTLNRVQSRSFMGWGQDEVVVLHTGNMGVKQGLENVVEAARLATTIAPSLRFVLMGDGGERKKIEELAEGVDSIQIVDPVASEIYGDILKAADFLLVNELPGVAEMALPSKLTSYLGSGRPIIAATNQNGITASELLSAKAGVVVEAGNPEDLVGKILDLTAADETREGFGLEGKKYLAETLSERAAVASFISALEHFSKLA